MLPYFFLFRPSESMHKLRFDDFCFFCKLSITTKTTSADVPARCYSVRVYLLSLSCYINPQLASVPRLSGTTTKDAEEQLPEERGGRGGAQKLHYTAVKNYTRCIAQVLSCKKGEGSWDELWTESGPKGAGTLPRKKVIIILIGGRGCILCAYQVLLAY